MGQKFRADWSQIVSLEVGQLTRLGVFAGFRGALDFEDFTPEQVLVAHDAGGDTLHVGFDWPVDRGGLGRIHCEIGLVRASCRFGGHRIYFRCPRCDARVLRLALLPWGLVCGSCGRITWPSRRETQMQRLVRRANRLAGRLGLAHFMDQPVRPSRMRDETFLRLATELLELRHEIERRASARVARAGGSLEAMAALVRWGI